MRNGWNRVRVALCGALALAGAAALMQPARAAETVHIGWTPGWTPEANIAVVLIHTDILARNGVHAKFTPFVGGGPANEAMLAGDIDMEMVGDAPALALAARGDIGVWVAKVEDQRGALIVRKDSPLKSIADLKGKKVAAFISSGVYAQLYGWLEAAHLRPGKDVQIVNLQPTDWVPALRQKGVDAFMAWDPIIANAALQPDMRILHQGVTVSPGVMILRHAFVSKHPKTAVRLVAAYKEAIVYMVTHEAQTTAWVAKATGLLPAAIETANSYDSNWSKAHGPGSVHIRLSPAQLAALQAEGAFLVKLGQLGATPDVKKAYDPRLLDSAEKSMHDFDFATVKITH